MAIISWLVVGMIAGWLSARVAKGGVYGVIGDVVYGMIGGVIGGFLATNLLGLGLSGIHTESIVTSATVAVIVVYASRLLARVGRSTLSTETASQGRGFEA